MDATQSLLARTCQPVQLLCCGTARLEPGKHIVCRRVGPHSKRGCGAWRGWGRDPHSCVEMWVDVYSVRAHLLLCYNHCFSHKPSQAVKFASRCIRDGQR